MQSPTEYSQCLSKREAKMSDLVYYILCGLISIGILFGISLMSKVKTAVAGNLLSTLLMGLAVLLTLFKYEILSYITLWIFLILGALIGLIASYKIKMIQMPQVVALLNGFGGASAALIAVIALSESINPSTFTLLAGALTLIIGTFTFTGSLVAAGKLHHILKQKPVVFKHHQGITMALIILNIAIIILITFNLLPILVGIVLDIVLSAVFGIVFSIRIGGADMPIAISLLISLSGIACAVTGMTISDPLLVSIGGIVGASGLILTQIMCKSMNRKLGEILTGKTSVSTSCPAPKNPVETNEDTLNPEKNKGTASLSNILRKAKKVIIVPGYGMALAQAQGLVKSLADDLEANGTEVSFAIHPVAGRMPGHMNVLLCEVDIPYEKLKEMDTINPEFKDADAVIVIGANDVINPAAKSAEGTPIYGMPILNIDESPEVLICNFDTKPGYAGVDNPLYEKNEGVTLLLGDAKESLIQLRAALHETAEDTTTVEEETGAKDNPIYETLKKAKKVIIVPGYGMALAQAQTTVKKITEKMEKNGTEVLFAIHPVAGRMPGHMNVLLCEVDIPYEKLCEMDTINSDFKTCDATIVVGANDVINPAAKSAEGTPIYGMPILNVEEAPEIIICNFDTKPGYAGVDNPLYDSNDNITLLLGDAKETLETLYQGLSTDGTPPAIANEKTAEDRLKEKLAQAKKVIIVPGYGMALAQTQETVKALSDQLEAQGTDVLFAIHPVAGRMPGHMNVLLCEVNIPYEKLWEMDSVNPEFKNCDVAIVVGANDVINPAAKTAECTPIYGMPILNVSEAPEVIICNLDTKPGYAGVDNPLYEPQDNVTLLLGDAKESLKKLLN